MKNWGIIILLTGVLAAGYALFVFDPSLASDFDGRRFNNLGLMQDRQNMLIAGCVAAIIGIILIVATVLSNQNGASSRVVTPSHYPVSTRDLWTSEQTVATEEMRDAIRLDDDVRVLRLLDEGVVKAYGELTTGRGFLQYAVRSNAGRSVELLIKRGATPGHLDSTGTSAHQLSNDANPTVAALLVTQKPAMAVAMGPDIVKVAPDVARQLTQLAELLNAHILTTEEFRIAKDRVLNLSVAT